MQRKIYLVSFRRERSFHFDSRELVSFEDDYASKASLPEIVILKAFNNHRFEELNDSLKFLQFSSYYFVGVERQNSRNLNGPSLTKWREEIVRRVLRGRWEEKVIVNLVVKKFLNVFQFLQSSLLFTIFTFFWFTTTTKSSDHSAELLSVTLTCNPKKLKNFQIVEELSKSLIEKSEFEKSTRISRSCSMVIPSIT